MSSTVMPAITAALPAAISTEGQSLPQSPACEAALFEQLMAPQMAASLSSASAPGGDDEDQDDES